MIFNSIEFTLFFPIVFLLYWFVLNKNLKLQNVFLVAASYFFYGWWDWRFLSLIIFSSIVDYFIGLKLGRESDSKKRKLLMMASVLTNLGLLGIFKYYNFFVDNFVEAFTLLGMPFETSRLDIILPVGISFYTFQTLSYSIDVYQEKLKPTKDIVAFFAFVSFFPQLVAGPIERATNLLPQFFKKRIFDFQTANDAIRQILLGFFKKVVIADNCAVYVDQIFSNPEVFSSGTLVLGTILFAIQIYGDFSGYSDIAIGTAKLLGFQLMQNFDTPYFSKSITELWRRWHISLSTWFGDYLYNPISFSLRRKFGFKGLAYASIVVFTIIGFWHGAAWTFIIFGLLHGIALAYELLTRKFRKKIRKKTNHIIYNFVSRFFTLLFWLITLIFFRSTDIISALEYTKNVFVSAAQISMLTQPFAIRLISFYLIFVNFLILLVLEWINRGEEHSLKKVTQFKLLNILLYLYFFDRIINNIAFEQPFVYFQF